MTADSTAHPSSSQVPARVGLRTAQAERTGPQTTPIPATVVPATVEATALTNSCAKW